MNRRFSLVTIRTMIADGVPVVHCCFDALIANPDELMRRWCFV